VQQHITALTRVKKDLSRGGLDGKSQSMLGTKRIIKGVVINQTA